MLQAPLTPDTDIYVIAMLLAQFLLLPMQKREHYGLEVRSNKKNKEQVSTVRSASGIINEAMTRTAGTAAVPICFQDGNSFYY